MLKTMVIGNLGRDAEVKVLPNDSNRKVANFSVCHSEKWKDKNGNPVSRETWFECSLFGEQLNVAPFLKKGQQVYVEGAISCRAYTTQEGELRSSLQLTVYDVQLLGAKKDEPAAGAATNA